MGSSGFSDCVSYQLKKWPRYRSSVCIVWKQLAVRSANWPAVMYPKS